MQLTRLLALPLQLQLLVAERFLQRSELLSGIAATGRSIHLLLLSQYLALQLRLLELSSEAQTLLNVHCQFDLDLLRL